MKYRKPSRRLEIVVQAEDLEAAYRGTSSSSINIDLVKADIKQLEVEIGLLRNTVARDGLSITALERFTVLLDSRMKTEYPPKPPQRNINMQRNESISQQLRGRGRGLGLQKGSGRGGSAGARR